MTWQETYLICFVVGLGWTVITLIMGGLHLHLPNVHGTGVHAPGGLHAGSLHGHAPHGGSHATASHSASNGGDRVGMNWMSSLLNPSALSVFLAWFGGAGYLLTRGATLAFWLVLLISALTGTAGAFVIAWVMRLVTRHEKPLDPADYEMIGVLGTVTSVVRPGGVGEMVYVREGARRPLAVRAENGRPIERGTEVVVTRLEGGVAFVRTWADFENGLDRGAPGIESTGQGMSIRNDENATP